MQNLTIGIDVGGTKVAGGLVARRGKLAKTLFAPTRAKDGVKASFGQVRSVIERLLRFAGGKENVRGVGVCCPGVLDPETGRVINAPNLPGWEKLRLGVDLKRSFGLPIRVENDANAAGLAEALFGAAVGYRNVFYVTVSTGIGTGIIINRRIYHGSQGVGAEGGHVSIDFRSPYRCGCGALGCIEALASGPAMARRARVHLEQEFKKPSLLRELTKGQLRFITPETIEQAARKGDEIAQLVIEETAFYLGAWLGGIISLLDPGAIVIGGGVARIGKPLFDGIRRIIPRYTVNPHLAAKIPLLPAKLQENVGVYGAASLFSPDGEEAEASA